MYNKMKKAITLTILCFGFIGYSQSKLDNYIQIGLKTYTKCSMTIFKSSINFIEICPAPVTKNSISNEMGFFLCVIIDN